MLRVERKYGMQIYVYTVCVYICIRVCAYSYIYIYIYVYIDIDIHIDFFCSRWNNLRETQKDKKNKVITDYLIIMMQPLKEIIFFVTIQEAGKQVQQTNNGLYERKV